MSHPAIAAEVPVVDCKQGDIRLQYGQNIREGLVQVCINQAWGTVCSTLFSDIDAGVICSQLRFERNGQFLFICFRNVCIIGMFSRVGVEIIAGGVAVPDFIPIFISDLRCSKQDSTILACMGSAPGVTQCMHSQDAYIRCQG